MYVILNPKFRSCCQPWRGSIHMDGRHGGSGGVLFAERFGCVMYFGGECGRTVVPRKWELCQDFFPYHARVGAGTVPPDLQTYSNFCSADLLASIIVFGGRQIPVRGVQCKQLCEEVCLYPVQGGLRCAGVIGPNLSTRGALWMICA